MRNSRDLGISGGQGKGDADRSPRWRANYHLIEWPAMIDDAGVIRSTVDSTFKRIGNKLVKQYGKSQS